MTESEKTLQGLTTFLHRAKYVNVVVAADDASSEPPAQEVPVASRLTVQRLTLHKDVAENFRRIAAEAVRRAGEVELRPYDPGYKPEGDELCYLALEELPELQNQLEEVGDLNNADAFGEADEVVDAMRFYAIVVGAEGGRQAVFFRSYSPKKELSRKSGFALMLQRGSYNRVHEKVFLFDESIDCFAWEGVLYVRNVHAFQAIFQYFERLRARAEQTISVVAKQIPISNVDAFQAQCLGNRLMMAKLLSISRKPYLTSVTMVDIKRTITEFNLPIQITADDGVERVVFDASREQRWIILKLLDDDYLGSIMTKAKYAANSKTPI